MASTSNNNSAVISTSWQLNETAGGAIAIAKGVLKAATSDNVQPLAIMAAEAFGATLAMCRETQMKVEQAARMHHTSYVLEFLKSSIGYSTDDCAAQLALSSSGVRFLGLAAALLTTNDVFTASQALELMMTTSKGHNQLLPTTRQLKDLLGALEHKLNRTGFAESVAGWETFMAEHPKIPESVRISNIPPVFHPSIEALQALVDALRSLGRLGNVTSVQIRAETCVPWVIAFVKWSCGEPPNIILEDGTILIRELHHRVTVVPIMKGIEPLRDQQGVTLSAEIDQLSQTVEITTYQGLDEPRKLWTTSVDIPRPWCGMVSVGAYGRKRVRELGMSSNSVLLQAMSLSIKLVASKLRAELAPSRCNTVDSAKFAKFKVGLFSPDSDLKDTLHTFLNIPEAKDAALPELRPGESIMGLPIIQSHLRSLQETCGCSACSGELGKLISCLKQHFTNALADLTAEVLALSLFDTTDQILVYAGGSLTNDHFWEFTRAIQRLLEGGNAEICYPMTIVGFALALIGHKLPQKNQLSSHREKWIASEAKGQVVYLQMFDSGIINAQGVLKLGGAPGKLVYDGLSFEVVLGAGVRDWNFHAKSKYWHGKPVDRIVNLVPSEQIVWDVRKGDGILHLVWGSTSKPKSGNPCQILEALAESLFLGRCSHSEDSVMEQPDANSCYVTPLFANPDLETNMEQFENHLRVVAVAGNHSMRMFALTAGKPGVIRGRACLRCCLDLCREAGLAYVVL